MGWYSAKPQHFPEEQRKILRAVALAYRRVMRTPHGWRKNVRARRWLPRPQSMGG
jgi:hypothetical protein